MTLEFLPEAATEFYEAAAQYEVRQEGLRARFRGEVLEVCRLVVRQPSLWRERSGGYRRVNCPVFPYFVAYFLRGDLILVAAVAHGIGIRTTGRIAYTKIDTEPCAPPNSREPRHEPMRPGWRAPDCLPALSGLRRLSVS